MPDTVQTEVSTIREIITDATTETERRVNAERDLAAAQTERAQLDTAIGEARAYLDAKLAAAGTNTATT